MMQQFKAIPATELKIDRSFVREMISDDRDRILIQKTIEMGTISASKLWLKGRDAGTIRSAAGEWLRSRSGIPF